MILKFPKPARMSDNGGVTGGEGAATTTTVAAATAAPTLAPGNVNLTEVLSFLRKNGLTGAEQLIQKQFTAAAGPAGGAGGAAGAAPPGGATDSNVLSSYKADSDPGIHAEAYKVN